MAKCPVINQFCCCCPLKVGVLILGWLHLIIGLLGGLVLTIITVVLKPEHLDDTEFVKISDDKYQLSNSFGNMVVDFHWIKTVFAVTAVLCFLYAACALVGIIGACLEKASCVFLFAVFYLISIIVCNISAIVGYATWDFDEVVTTTVMDGDKEKKVEVNGGLVIGLTAVFQVAISALQVYFAVCLFSFYYELKNKKEVERRDSEMATFTKNVS